MLHLVRQLRALLSPRDKWRSLGLVGLMAVGALLELAGLGLAMPLVAGLTKPELLDQNRYLRAIRDAAAPATPGGFVAGTAAAVAALFVVKNLYQWWLVRRQTRFVTDKAGALATRLFDRYLGAPYAFHLRRNSADCICNVNRVAAVLTDAFLPLLGLVSECVVMAALFGALLAFAPAICLVLAAATGVVFTAAYWPFRHAQERAGARRRRASDALYRVMAQTFGAIKEIDASGRGAAFARRHADLQREDKAAMGRAHALGQMPRFFIETAMVALVMAALAASALAGVADGTILLRFSLLAMAMFRVMPSLSRVQYALAAIRQQREGFDLVFRDFTEMPPPPPAPTGPPLAFDRAVTVEDLAFRHDGAARTLFAGVSFALRRDTSTALVGPTGGGKTTLVDVVAGLLAPTAGRVAVDGRDVRANLPSWRARLGYVPQHVYLLDDTVRANVAFGVEPGDVDDARVREALDLAQAREFVDARPDGLDAAVGEAGARLSGGQRQRLGIARALYGRPSLLILDEATSALDLETERAFARALAGLRGRVTILLVAHRPATVEHCDQILRVDAGGVSTVRAYPPAAGEGG